MSTYKNRKGHPLNLTPAEKGERAAKADEAASQRAVLAAAVDMAKGLVFELEEALGIIDRPATWRTPEQLKAAYAEQIRMSIKSRDQVSDLLQLIRY